MKKSFLDEKKETGAAPSEGESGKDKKDVQEKEEKSGKRDWDKKKRKGLGAFVSELGGEGNDDSDSDSDSESDEDEEDVEEKSEEQVEILLSFFAEVRFWVGELKHLAAQVPFRKILRLFPLGWYLFLRTL